MTIYVAVCDDNIADRKQTERLLGREKDARLREKYDVIYIDTFGSEDALMHTPIKYDIFIIDVTTGSKNGMDLARALRKKGISAPIVLCSSTIDYKSYVNSPKDIIFIEKPISAGQISHLIDVAAARTSKKIPLVEIRCQKETYFYPYTDIIKATPKAKFLTEITLADGNYLNMTDSITSFKNMCAPYKCFVKCNKELVNVLHIKASEKNGFRLTNEDIVTYNFTQKDKIISTMASVIPLLKQSHKED